MSWGYMAVQIGSIIKRTGILPAELLSEPPCEFGVALKGHVLCSRTSGIRLHGQGGKGRLKSFAGLLDLH